VEPVGPAASVDDSREPGRPRVLIAYASQGGSTAEIAQAIGIALIESGCDIDVRPVRQVQQLTGFEAVIVGSALYHGVWLPDAFKFLRRRRDQLATLPVWLFDSGPLDRSAEDRLLPLPSGVAALAAAIGVRGHTTFGGRLGRTDLTVAERLLVMEGLGGDYRNFPDIRAWAQLIARELTTQAPGTTPGPAPQR
jgi:menaquinone-dependent protoporphyrinogen oxidase